MRSSLFARFLTSAALAMVSVGGLIGQTPAAAGPLASSNDGRLSDAQAIKLYERTLQLMEAGGIFLPDLTRASRPLIENANKRSKA